MKLNCLADLYSLKTHIMDAAEPPRPIIAAIGVLSHGPNAALRAVIRRSWLSRKPPSDLVVRFVIRKRGASASVLHEASRHQDTALVDAPAKLGHKQGPLTSLFLWWRHAMATWTTALFIGKADDDVYIHVPGLAAHLWSSQAAVVVATGSHRPRILWGAIEGAHFDERRKRPAAFQRRFPVGYPCAKRSRGLCGSQQCGVTPCGDGYGAACGAAYKRSLHGPFPFAKGPLYFLSAPLVAELLASDWLARHLQATLQSAANESFRERNLPWEDVYSGYAAARVAKAGDDLAIVDATPIVSDAYGVRVRPATQVWHMHHTYRPSRIAFVHHWLEARQHACPVDRHHRAVRCRVAASRCGKLRGECVSHSCTMARWQYCVHEPAPNCSISTKEVELKHDERRWSEQQRQA